ncbi:hypothetical protein CVV26_02870 [Candidatus Kuenenbacteria bacterium HGW-Kuenenbacteria-1]|uniref:Uncharacterized protein n=1 Tax=Candidatus Kuenenbacteria bacterium HGW-Kuenenbacteria-1 TaxID=2013812 RepID=A0A2N1UMY7_9BACT|nr:MAG: hypothetical protein CVV26_02870 [Candidatus Kuenenbacteria bacterium HGW-Kuenenbacteria-1]
MPENNFENISKDLNTLDLKNSSNPKFKEAQDEDIYVMPIKFLEKHKKKKKNVWVLLLSIFLILIVLSVGVVFLFNEKARKIFFMSQKKPVIEINGDKEKPVDLGVKNNEKIEIAQTIKTEVKDKDGKVISRAQVTLPFGFIDSEEKPKIISQYPSKSYFMIDPRQDIIGGIYTFVPSNIKLKRSITLILGYDDKIISNYKEKDFRVAFLENGKWNFLEAQQDVEGNTFTVTLLDIKDVYTILVSKTEEILAGLDTDLDIINPDILPSTTDSDFDGLTDVEEGFFQTDPQRADSDLGGYPDGWEVINLFSPNDGALYPLSNSGTIKIYTDPIYKYSIFYLKDFLVNFVDNKTIFIPPIETGESIIVIVQENPEKLKSKEWYIKQFEEKTLDKAKLKTSIVDGIEGVWSVDTQNFYLAKDNLIYVFSYNSSLLNHLNFKTVFKMMINSFKFNHKGEKIKTEEEVVKEGEKTTQIEETKGLPKIETEIKNEE